MNEQAMLECIKDESSVIQEILENPSFYTKDMVDHFLHHNVKRIYFSGHGSPFNVGGVLRFMMENLLQVEVSVDYASLFNHHLAFNPNGMYQPDEMLLICPAQSGKTKGPVDAAKHAHELGIPVLCTTLDEDGILAINSDIVIPKRSGKEMSFPETKGHVASLAILMLNIIEIAKATGKIDSETYQAYLNDFAKIPTHIDQIVDRTLAWYEQHNSLLKEAKDLTFIGYGENYATAVEGSLKVLETTLKPCLSYECEEYMHGQNQPVNQDSVIFMIASNGAELDRIHALASWCRHLDAHVFLIGDQHDSTLTNQDLALPITTQPYLSAIEYLIPFQIIGYTLANDMGLSSIVANHDDAGKELGYDMNNTHYIIATHGKLSQGFAHTIALLTHKHNIHALTAYDEEEFPDNLISLMDQYSEDGVVVFTDLTCGSVTQKIMELYGSKKNLHVFAGVNLALILEVLLYDQLPDEDYCNQVIQSAKDQICYLHGIDNTRE